MIGEDPVQQLGQIVPNEPGTWGSGSGSSTSVAVVGVANLAPEDVVEALADSDGVLWMTRKISAGGRLVVRVIPFDDGPLDGALQAVLAAFARLGVSGEGAGPAYRLVALDIAPDSDLPAIVNLLRPGKANGSWDYDEGCVTQAWLAL